MDEPINLNFEISSHIIRQLGAELVTDDVTAILELVKNAYDADARNVRIDIKAEGKPNLTNLFFKDNSGYIMIADNGDGMSYQQIINGWLKISASEKRDKKKNEIKSVLGRGPLGDKGLGRLSSQRLGSTLEILTSPKGEKKLFHLGINWDSFYPDLDLKDVKVAFKEVDLEQPIADGKIRTTLVISGLRNKTYFNKEVSKLKSDLVGIIAPTSENEIDNFNIDLRVNGETYDIKQDITEIFNKTISEYTLDFDGNKYTINGEINARKFLSNNSSKDQLYYENLIAHDNAQSFFEHFKKNEAKKAENFTYQLGAKNPIQFKIVFYLKDIPGIEHLFDKEQASLANPGKFFGEIKEYALNQRDFIGKSNVEALKAGIGIKIYRNRFAVKPYGFEGNDWLSLGSSQTSGTSFYGLRPHNTRGYFYLDVYDNSGIKEKTDREGFVDNEYSRNFIYLNHHAISNHINNYLGFIRRAYNEYKKLFDTNNVKIEKPSPESTFGRLKSFHKELLTIRNEYQKVPQIQKSIDDHVNNLYKVVEKSAQDNIKLIQKKFDELKGLDGKLNKLTDQYNDIDSVLRVVENHIEQIEEQKSHLYELASLGLTTETLSHEINNIVNRLGRKLKELSIDAVDSKQKLQVFIISTQSILSTLKKQLSHINPSLKYIREKKEHVSLKGFIDEVLDYYSYLEAEGGIMVTFTDNSSDDLSVSINKGRLIQVFDNIILNSVYWLRNTNHKLPSKTISITLHDQGVDIWDSGLGIDPSIESMLFEPFTTLKPKGEGRGLGLYIIKELLSSLGADIYLLEEKNTYKRRFKFRIDLQSLTEGK